ncbi:hypothetical protein VOLCADRAFT_97543 [Volvox carteri f. nagariensis]|uniref:Programmed cell death protein 2 C-terminal domain-containing protein n=1 Tax=Volvox carteri f. nagariensis TaxID=3068 RepID=D8UD05_VOLCA|nr:uncharacterized protein VOLCADRAFT_97543 [Volvox carteri f. nagariensis]EFJ42432.1 hypothetical protein VOLCADRAFT_97543 [Volvox carteri f. nagariensis]|eukprot:XP_002956495.1 hypothetical protein VOLCADRAFT_97543 [Volvox carteri f. nagariensis]
MLRLGSTGCGNDSRCWRAFRCQKAPPTAAMTQTECGYEDEPISTSTPTSGLAKRETPPGPKPAAVTAAPDYNGAGVPNVFGNGFDCDDGFSFGGDASDKQGCTGGFASSAALDFSDLGAILEDCAVQQLQQSNLGKPEVGKECTGGSGPDSPRHQAADCTPSAELPLSGPTLPEFHIMAVEEPTGQRNVMGSADDVDRVQQLLEEYERQEGQRNQLSSSSCRLRAASSGSKHDGHRAAAGSGGDGVQVATYTSGAASTDADRDRTAKNAAAVVAGTGGVVPCSEDGDDLGSWAGEEYEEDHVRGVQGAYLKYAARLARQPDQCARTFEVQLMAPVLAMVLDCAEWLQGLELEMHRPAINAAANWDFTTLAIYTCSANCYHGRLLSSSPDLQQEDTVLVEEYVAVANEDQSHVRDELKIM